MARNRRKEIRKRWLHKFRLVVLNEETFEEHLTFRLSRLNIFVTLGFLAIILIALTTFVIAFTPLKEYIPGYSSTHLKRQALQLNYKTDSLEKVIQRNNDYFSSIQMLLRGDTVENTLSGEELTTVVEQQPENNEIDVLLDDSELNPSQSDLTLRREVEEYEKYNILDVKTSIENVKLFKPVQGRISERYNIEKKHYGIDISLDENTPAKAVTDGIVIFAEWTLETGYVIILKHDNNLISIYKHNLSLLKKQGEYVQEGEVIALTGNTGEYTTGPHLHFELWKDGHAIDPEMFFDFE